LTGLRLAFIALWALILAGPALSQAPPEPAGYRLDDYRAPTPATLNGAKTLTTSEAEALWRAREAVFVDVMPLPPRPANLPPETLWRTPPRDSIPGSLWLPNVGYGEIASETDAYFRRSLAAATLDDLSRPLVIFCMRACWMSWNAAKRAISYGYTSISWFADGTDGWREAGLPLERLQPVP
jgi:PQQ-dependent catabolism-associated CXXCW motif protein